MLPVDCRGGYSINTCINTILNDSTVSNGVNNVVQVIDVAGCETFLFCQFFPPSVNLFTFLLKIENHSMRSFDACKQSNVESGQ